ncbi:MAG: TMEM43 family protein [Bacteroidales bacterium]|nr:TMEM43 family protein [Bacteroidales bacterium]
MAVTETTTTSYGTRVKRSAGGIKSGFIFLIAGTGLLWWNEGRAVKTTDLIEEAQDVAVHIENVETVDPSLNGKLIHATADATTQDVLTDADFGISTVAIKLDRKVEFYQYVENCQSESKDRMGGSEETVKTYTCEERWTLSPVNSSEFHGANANSFRNFALMNFDEKSSVANNVSFGGYTLNGSLVGGITGQSLTTVDLDTVLVNKWNSIIRQTMRNPDEDYVHVNGNIVYFGRNPYSPQIGDVKVTFTQVNPGTVSVLAQVNGSTFESFTAKNGKTLSAIRMGSVSMNQMFEEEKDSNKTWTWVWRVVGWLLVCSAFKRIFSIISTIFKVVPFVANILNWGISLVGNILGTVWALLVIGIAWLAYRPVLSCCILGVAAIIIVYYMFRGKNKQPEAVAAAQETTTLEKTQE